MRHALSLALLWLLCAGTALADCAGRDLRATLDPQTRAVLDERVAETPYPEGNHWRATRGDTVLHLIGTMHLADPRSEGPLARLAPLIEGAGRVLLEMTETEQAALEEAVAGRPDMMLLSEATLPELLPEADWQALSQAVQARGLPAIMAAKMQPWYLSMLLAVPACMSEAILSGGGLDARIEALARAAGVPVSALEPFDTGFAVFAEAPMDLQLAMVRSALASPEASEDLFETLLAAYFDEAHAEGQIVLELLSPQLTALDGAESGPVFDAVDQRLLTARNRAWLPVLLEAAETTQGPVVAAFGAAHLSGANGVPALLEAEGFTLERLPF
ncbi:TraB/GumN family protein [Pseudoponticoccus marisrubri]|uniref:Polysaccharide biosynthesis protein GumN n=1 Tax=Pseudoponticoccus marisrubri TaxID=1685382 RepID=A0A0W7WPS2_9RHOB|nr:TraB/GumN family protein [Pseudoponticoccus marisrubri]KUF12586.1 polysaccharide biosynthesis protein GumN [Pseudoponticoccus marisrubri]